MYVVCAGRTLMAFSSHYTNIPSHRVALIRLSFLLACITLWFKKKILAIENFMEFGYYISNRNDLKSKFLSILNVNLLNYTDDNIKYQNK